MEKNKILYRERFNRSEGARRLIKLGLEHGAQQRTLAGEAQGLAPSQTQKEQEIFRLLNRNEKPWEIAEKLGKPELVHECYTQRIKWIEMERVRDAEVQKLKLENHRLRVEKECYMLKSFALERKECLSSKLLAFLLGIIVVCWAEGVLPSEFIKKDFGVSLDEFMHEIDKQIKKEEEEERAALSRIIEASLSRHR